MIRGFRWLATVGVALVAALPLHGFAQGYPVRPVRIVVPYPPGGSTDILARLLAERLTPNLGQTVLVENRAGATGLIGAEAVAKAPPDGYTLLMAVNGPLAIMPAIREKMPYDAARDFAPIILAARAPKLLVVHPSIPATTPQELVAFLKSGQRTISYGSSGFGTTGHLAAELLKLNAGVDMTHVPYKGAGPAIADLVAGHVQVAIEVMPQLLPLVQSGKLRALAITSTGRSPVLPNLPTMAESGQPGFESYTWFGMVAPAGTPQPILDRLNSEFARVLATADMRKRIDELGAEYAPNTTAEFGRFMSAEREKWRRVVRAAQIKE